MSGPRWLVILESPFRGELERAYIDSLYQTRVCRAQLQGRLDVLLRGEAVLLLRMAEHGGVVGDRGEQSVAEGFAALISDGVQIMVETESHVSGVSDMPRGVSIIELAREDVLARWHEYDAILYF